MLFQEHTNLTRKKKYLAKGHRNSSGEILMLQLHGLRLLNEGINFLQNKQMAALTSLLADLLDGLDSKHELGQQKPLHSDS